MDASDRLSPSTHSTPVASSDPKRRSALWGWARVLAGVLLVVFILSRVDLGEATPRSWERAGVGGSLAVALLLLAQFLSALRWRAILPADPPPTRYLFRLYLVGQFFGLFLPTSVGGDALRVVWIGRATGQHASAVASVFLDRLLGVAALALYLALGIAIAGRSEVEALGMSIALGERGKIFGIAAVLVSLVVAIVVWKKMRDHGKSTTMRRRVEEAARVLRRPARDWVAPALLALAVQGCYLVTWWLLVVSLQLPVPPPFLLLAVPAVSLAAMLPLTISGLGVREGAWIALLAPLGVSAPDALTCSLLYFVAFTLVGAIGGVWFAAAGVAPTARETATTRDAQPRAAQEVA